MWGLFYSNHLALDPWSGLVVSGDFWWQPTTGYSEKQGLVQPTSLAVVMEHCTCENETMKVTKLINTPEQFKFCSVSSQPSVGA